MNTPYSTIDNPVWLSANSVMEELIDSLQSNPDRFHSQLIKNAEDELRPLDLSDQEYHVVRSYQGETQYAILTLDSELGLRPKWTPNKEEASAIGVNTAVSLAHVHNGWLVVL